MATILLTWELGGGLGHLVNLRPFAVELSRRGHRVVAALKDLTRAEAIFGGGDVRYLQAPVNTCRTDVIASPATFAHLLHNVGFADAQQLRTMTGAWREIYDFIQPDVVVLDHSPTALLALRGYSARRALVGTGFFTPPAVYPLPTFRESMRFGIEQWRRDEDALLDRVNQLLASWGQPPLTAIADLFAQVDENFLATFKELDHYPNRGESNYWGVWPAGVGEKPNWPEAGGPRVFAYLKPFPALPGVLRGLREIGACALVYVDGLPRKLEHLASDTLRFHRGPVELAQVGRECDLAVLNGNHGTTSAMLLAGKPTLQIPLTLEQLLFANAIVRCGAGTKAKANDADDIRLKLKRMLSSRRFSVAAQGFAGRYAGLSPTTVTAAMADRVEELVANRAVGKSVVAAKSTLEVEVEPRALVHWKRFDVMAKYIYARNWIRSTAVQWSEELYLEHLRVMNGFRELTPRKDSACEFLETFHELLVALRNDSSTKIPPVPVGCDGALVNGAHRVAAFLAFGRPIRCWKVDGPGYDYSAKWFRQPTDRAPRGLATKYADAMALEYCRLKPDIALVIIPPALAVYDQRIVDALISCGTIAYGKAVQLDRNGPRNLGELAYWLEHRADAPSIEGLRAAELRLTAGPALVFVFEPDPRLGVTGTHERVRAAIGPQGNAAWITNRPTAARFLSQTLLHQPSLRHLNSAQPWLSPRFHAALETLISIDDGRGSEDSCIVGEGVAAVYGQRDSDNLTFVNGNSADDEKGSPRAGSNRKLNRRRLTDLAFDPRCHFFYRGFKFATPAMNT